MSRIAKKTEKKSEVKESKKYTNLLEAYGAFWRRGYTEWAGTSSRSEYWLSYLMNWLVSVGWVFLIAISGFSYSEPVVEFVFSPITVILLLGLCLFIVAIFLPVLSLVVRRLHDAGLSAWWLLLLLLCPISNLTNFAVSIIFFVFSVLPTKVKGNPYHKFNK